MAKLTQRMYSTKSHAAGFDILQKQIVAKMVSQRNTISISVPPGLCRSKKDNRPKCVEYQLADKYAESDFYIPAIEPLSPDQKCRDTHERKERRPDRTEYPRREIIGSATISAFQPFLMLVLY